MKIKKKMVLKKKKIKVFYKTLDKIISYIELQEKTTKKAQNLNHLILNIFQVLFVLLQVQQQLQVLFVYHLINYIIQHQLVFLLFVVFQLY